MKVLPHCLLLLAALPLWGRFELAAPGRTAGIHVPPGEPECVRLAAQDLASDVLKIAGRAPRIVARLEDCGRPCVTLARAGAGWERYRVFEPGPGLLRIEGSDERGIMFGIYAFLERYLEVDPLYFWTGREPKPRPTLAWESVRIEAGEPAFRYRGWFVNDEDLLTEWEDGGGKRDIDYPYYHQVTSPNVLARVYEAALRLQYNLIIPASFTDIANPAEERMVRDAVRRGLMVSMHHVEPMGVSAFAFANYWKARGRQVPYTFHSQRPAFEEVWRHFAARWARYPGVVWQLGLRGVADRPAWHNDPSAPRTDEARGRMISDAMALQWEIVRSVDKRPAPPATTTLWMEGAELNRRGFLTFPKGVTVVFADNSPGWKMQRDFHETPREPGRTYGIYYHHAVWGWGPHLVQGVPPWKTHAIFA
ncbi:MAG: glycosyl hydrolase 115 family protein, partial [Dehalococcoidia bacterium]|nr:glycosyl hydrolase 115 family protein [Dehalococcoidia bacterium]